MHALDVQLAGLLILTCPGLVPASRLLCIGPGFSLFYHRVTPFEGLGGKRQALTDSVAVFRWWTVLLPLPSIPFFIVITYMLKHNVDFKILRALAQHSDPGRARSAPSRVG